MTGADLLELVKTIGGIVGLLAVPGGIAAVLLNRKGANKSLEIQQGGLDVQTFDSQRAAYEDLLNRATAATQAAQNATAAALEELATYKAEREESRGQIEDTNDKLEKLRELFQSVVAGGGIVLTREQQAIFDDTKPTVRRARRPK